MFAGIGREVAIAPWNCDICETNTCFVDTDFLLIHIHSRNVSASRTMQQSTPIPPRKPLGPGPKDNGIDVRDYLQGDWPCVPIAVPSKSREDLLCQQTLTMLRSYGYDMSSVHIFVDASATRDDGTNEYDAYYHFLKTREFATVQVHPGGKNLREQYARIFEFFQNTNEIILASDTVPRIDWRPKKNNVELKPLPKDWLVPVIRIGFDLCRSGGARAWSLASCKAGLNLQPGHISQKCGLLCGNFCGVRMDVGPPIKMSVSDFTTDVEFSLRTWNQDGAMYRFLGIAASHKYRSRGGHRTGKTTSQTRYKATCKAIQQLSRDFPKLIRYEGEQKKSATRMNYRFLQPGPGPLSFTGTFTSRGRKPTNGLRAQTPKERQRQSRLRKKQRRR